jgi:hypothetical protein
MSANIHGKMIYSHNIPMWHSITEPSLVPMSAEAVLDEKFQGGYEIILRPVTVELNGQNVETGDFCIVRGKSPADELGEIPFGYCSDRFHPLQPREICQSFDQNVKEPAETVGVLGKGEDMFISWKMPSFEVVVGDELQLFGVVRSGFDALNATRLFTTIFRPICHNTVTMAENWAKANSDGKGKGNIWKGKGVNKNLLRDLGYWMAHVQGSALAQTDLLKDFFAKLVKSPIKTDAEALGLLTEAYPNLESVSEYFPKELVAAKEETTLEFNQGQEAIRVGIFDLFSGNGTGISADYYGLFNATSEYFCHVQPSKRPIAESVMFGGRQKNTMRMVDTLKRHLS